MTLTSSNSVHCSLGSSILALYKTVALAMRKFLASRSCRDILLRASLRMGVSLLMSSLQRPDSYNHKSLFIIYFGCHFILFSFFQTISFHFHFLQKNSCKALYVLFTSENRFSDDWIFHLIRSAVRRGF